MSAIGAGGATGRLVKSALAAFAGAVAVLAVFSAHAAVAAAAPAPSWSLQSRAPSTYFTPGHVAIYEALATNVGTGPAGEVTIADNLPAGVEFKSVSLYTSAFPGVDINEPLPETCPQPTGQRVTCSFPVEKFGASIQPVSAVRCSGPPSECSGGFARMVIIVTVPPSAPEGPISNEAVVEGGGASASASSQNTISSHPKFGVASFQMSSCADASGENPERSFVCDAPYTQAGGTPYELTTKVALNSEVEERALNRVSTPAAGDPKDIAVDLPPGLIVDPTATPTCSLADFNDPERHGECPASSQVGVALLGLEGHINQYPLYNLTPQQGRPGEFGIGKVVGGNYSITGSVRTGEDYGLSAISSGIPSVGRLTSATIILWGVPAEPSHDPQRGEVCAWASKAPPPERPFNNTCEGGGQHSGDGEVALVRLPTACPGEPPIGVAAADSWQEPGALNPNGSRDRHDPTWSTAAGSLPVLTGCGALQFGSSLEVQPDSTLAGEPAGLGVTLGVPQTKDPSQPTTPHVRNVRVALPMGMVISPSAAQGLTTCKDDLSADPLTQPNELGPSSLVPASCDPSSQVGTVRATSPDLAQPLDGKVFLGTPLCNPCTPADAQEGRMVRLYLQLVGEGSDALTVKLVGYGSIDQQTGQLTTVFTENPQLPFDKLTLSLGGGPRATLANPRTCGPAFTNADFTPWSSPFTPDSMPSSHFEVTGCPPPRFAPSFTAGTTSNQAGGFSPFTLAFGREDADGFLSGVQLHMPPGLLGMLSSVSLCGEPQAAQGSCGAASLIGHTQVLTGPGAEPFLVTGGQVFITGPYKGAPYGLSILVPAKAGPYTLSGTTGNGTVVVRTAIDVDPTTSQLVVTADPLPTAIDGIPLQLQVVNVMIDRPGFTFNPTDCNPLRIDGTLSSTQGQSAQVSSSFQVTNCAALAFKPKFSASTSGHTSRARGASLDVKLSYPKGSQGTQANIAKVKVDLPRQLPSRLTTLQKACPDSKFAANPALCPAGSIVGIARARTPLLSGELRGPAIFVSHGGAKFPELIVVLQGEGVRVDLHGETFISKAGITSSTFGQVPDVPVGSFELYLPEGPNSALAANGNLCKSKLTMPTVFTAQNGAAIHQSTPITVTGCGKTKAHKTRRARRPSHRLVGHGRSHKR